MIRQANKYDLSEIVRMLKNYREQAPTQFLKDSNNQEHIETLLSNIIAGAGFILLAEKEESIFGMLIAAQHPNIWNPEAMQMSEVAYWVDVEHRGGTAGYRLLQAYIQQCEEYKKENRIKFFTLSKMVNSPDLDYQKFGFTKLEETWFK